MDLTTRIFRDLATLARWAFQAAICEPGAYKLADVTKNKDRKFNISRNKLQTVSLPECATWADESEYIVKLSYNGGMQEYTFEIGNVFDLLARFKKIAVEDITAKEKSELCILNKKEKATGELLAVVEMPKSKTKQVAKAADKNEMRPQMCGVYVDKSGYIVASDGHVLNTCKIDGIFEPDFTGAILPTEFAKRADGCTVEIYRNGDKVMAYCGDDEAECITKYKYPNWRAVVDYNKIVRKGHVKVKYADLKKAVGKDEAVTLSMCDGGMMVSTFYEDDYPGIIMDRHIYVDAEHYIDEFAISVDTKDLKKVMPGCKDMYVTDNSRPIYFIGDGCLSMVMPLYKANISYCDLRCGETLVSAFDVLCDGVTKKDITAGVVTTKQPETETATAEAVTTEVATTDTSKEPEMRTESACTIITLPIIGSIRQTLRQSIYKPTDYQDTVGGLVVPNRLRLALRLRTRRYFAAPRVVGGDAAENAAERKETGKLRYCYGCKYRQFTRGSTLMREMAGMNGGINENIINRINKQYHGKMYCRGA